MNKKQTLIFGALLAGLGVALGAVGAHALKDVLIQNNRTDVFETAVKYQLYHGLAMLVVGVLAGTTKSNLNRVGVLFLSGVLLFSGSLYTLSLTSIKWIAYATPVGGVLMIGGWVLLLVHFFKYKEQD